MIGNSLNFNDILEEALHDWPAELDLVIKSYSSGIYSVQSLDEIGDDISDKYIGSECEIIMRNVHDAIFSSIHEVARQLSRIVLADLRVEFIAEKLKTNLERSIAIDGLGWNEVDKDLARELLSKLPTQ